MKKSFFRLPETITPQVRTAFQIAAAIAGAHFIALPYYLYLILSVGIVQFSMLTVITLALAISISIGTVIIWRGRPTTGIITVLMILAVSYPPISAFLVSGLGSVLGIALLLVGPMSAFQTLPQRSARVMTAITVASGLITLLLDVFGSTARPSLPGIFIPLLAASVVLVLAILVAYQFRNYRMGTKLVMSFVAVAVMAIGIVSFITYRITNAQITERVGTSLSASAEGAALEIASDVDDSINTLEVLTLNKFLQDTLETASAADTLDQSTFARLDQQWADASDSSPLIQGVLNNELSVELGKFQKKFPIYAEVFVTDKYGAIVASTNRTSDYFQADEEWWQTSWNNGMGAIYIGQPEFDESSNTMSINMAMPVSAAKSTELAGVLRATMDVTSLIKVVDSIVMGKTGHSDLLFRDQTYSAGELGLTPVDPKEMDGISPLLGTYGETTFEGIPSLVTFIPVKAHTSEHQNAIDQLGWSVIVHQSSAEAREPVTTTSRTILISALLIVLVVALAALGMAQILSGPIVRLTTVAEKISAGDINAQAEVEFGDETGTLAKTFNTMTSRLREILENLEQRVAARTRNLELAAEVGRTVSQVRALDTMLKDACELILKEFDLYYVQVYLTDLNQAQLRLEAGTGAVADQLLERSHSLPLNSDSINGRAAVEKRSVVISDTTQSSTFRQNPLLPDTRGEMAVPLIVADKVVGVLDMQSVEAGVLNQEVLPAFEALAGQLAVAIQNSNLLAETEQARAAVEKQARRLVREGWNEHLDAIHKPEQIGYVFDRKEITPLTDASEAQVHDSDRSVSAPIAITGEPLGSLIVEVDDDARKEQVSELVSTVARQVAQQIENLRLLESAERYRYEAEEASRQNTIEGWKAFMASRNSESLGYLYDTNEIRPYREVQTSDGSSMAVPIKAREETVGTLAVQGIRTGDQDAIELANAVADRLGAHIDNLRLLEETKRSQVELDKRARQLAAVAEISTASSQELEVEKLLNTVVHLARREFDLYHAHIFIFNEATRELKIAACGWKEGDANEGTHETVSIPLDGEQSLVARAARTGQSVIVNDVKNESGWLPNPLLPDTASEMAVPLMIGDRVLGVLDVQSDRIHAFTDEDANIQTTLASQVSTALQNARSYAKAQQQADRETTLNIIGQKIQSATTVESVLQIAARELGRALGAPLTIAQLGIKEKSDNGGNHN